MDCSTDPVQASIDAKELALRVLNVALRPVSVSAVDDPEGSAEVVLVAAAEHLAPELYPIALDLADAIEASILPPDVGGTLTYLRTSTDWQASGPSGRLWRRLYVHSVLILSLHVLVGEVRWMLDTAEQTSTLAELGLLVELVECLAPYRHASGNSGLL